MVNPVNGKVNKNNIGFIVLFNIYIITAAIRANKP